MKKLLSLILAIAAVVTASATDYTNTLNVTVSGTKSSQGEATISVVETDGKYTVTLRNFIFAAGDASIAVGNIEISDLEGTTADGVTTFDASVTAAVTEGDAGTSWWGPTLFGSGIPVALKAQMTDTELNAEITLTVMGMDILVEFGELTSGIGRVEAQAGTQATYFDMAGRRVSSLMRGHTYIKRTTDGKALKFIEK